MPLYNGNNNLTSKDLFDSRKFYKSAKTDFNSWYENKFYGKISQQGIPVIIKALNEPIYFTHDGELWNGSLHIMSDGSFMTGRLHDKNSKHLIRQEGPFLNPVTPGTDVLALNFVVDAFTDLKDYIEQVKITTTNLQFPKSLFNTSKLLRMEPAAAWHDPRESYINHMAKVYNFFVRNYLSEKRRFKKIKNFNDFINLFMEFAVAYAEKAPLTLEHYISSTLCTPRVSGLIVDLANEDQSNDIVKHEEYYKDPAFEFFRKTSAKFGFTISSNAPWRLYANLRSSAMQNYMTRRNAVYDINQQTKLDLNKNNLKFIESDAYGRRDLMTGKDISAPGTMYYRIGEKKSDRVLIKKDLFKLYYKPTCFLGLDMLKTEIWNFYNTFISHSPYVQQTDISKFCTIPKIKGIPTAMTKQKWFMREKISKSDFLKRYNNEYWAEIHAQIRMIEVGQYNDTKRVKKLMKEISSMNKKLDLENLMMYIDNNIRKFDSRFSKIKLAPTTPEPAVAVASAATSTENVSGGTTGY